MLPPPPRTPSPCPVFLRLTLSHPLTFQLGSREPTPHDPAKTSESLFARYSLHLLHYIIKFRELLEGHHCLIKLHFPKACHLYRKDNFWSRFNHRLWNQISRVWSLPLPAYQLCDLPDCLKMHVPHVCMGLHRSCLTRKVPYNLKRKRFKEINQSWI